MYNILLIDDDEKLFPPLKTYFERFDLNLTNAIHPADGLKRLEKEDFDLIILDIMLPDMNGFEVCKTIRQSSDIPIIMLTARGELSDKVVGLEIGSDDYLPKPFEPRELVARIQSILKRVQRQHQSVGTLLKFKDLEIDLDLRQATKWGEIMELTTMEYQLLIFLAQAPGKTFHRDEILNHLKGIDTEIFSRSIDILVSRLRKKLKPLQYIKTIWGSGYSFIGEHP